MTLAARQSDYASQQICLYGKVQGMGMRPFVCRLARELGLAGRVGNRRQAVMIQVAGPAQQVEVLIAELRGRPPTGARIDKIQRRDCTLPADMDRFAIDATPPLDEPVSGLSLDQLSLPPDRAACADCVSEVLDPANRRYRHALNACTECGPRYSILRDLPWERCNSSLADYPLCADCGGEYSDPDDRRLHAQSMTCHRCGPGMHLERMDGAGFSLEALTHLDAVDAAASLIQRGEIIAIQGVGGFHLACDATNAAAVAELRQRKHRPIKPLALMARDAEVIRRYARVSEAELETLAGPQAPIVLLESLPGSLPDGVAPGLREVGFMLPHTPLHHLMCRRLDRPVVMTSANRSGSPLCGHVTEVRKELTDVVDWILWHEREIANRIDDSVVRIREHRQAADRLQILRLGRGYAPASRTLPPGFQAAPSVLAIGGHLKNSLCLLQGSRAVLSPYIGDLDSPAQRARQQDLIASLQRLYGFHPRVLAADCHPDYASTCLAVEVAAGRPLEHVQHHHAHAAACMAEHGRDLAAAPLLCVIFDGMGYGEDGGYWGGEFLLADYRGYRRLASLFPVSLAGADRVATEPWRSLLGQLLRVMPVDELMAYVNALPAVFFDQPLETLAQVVGAGRHSLPVSSAGRLFDAVACALGLPLHSGGINTGYEAEAAMQLEALARQGPRAVSGYRFSRVDHAGLTRLDPAAMWPELLSDLAAGRGRAEIARAFHAGLAEAVAELCSELYEAEPCWHERLVVLGGGVFQNALLCELTEQALGQAGFRVLMPGAVPASDNGLAFGQAVVAAARQISRQTDVSAGEAA